MHSLYHSLNNTIHMGSRNTPKACAGTPMAPPYAHFRAPCSSSAPSPQDRVRNGKLTAPAAVRSTHQYDATHCGPELVLATATQGTESSSIPGQGRVGHDNSRQRSTRNPPDSQHCQHDDKDARHTRCRMQQKRTPTTRGSDDRKVNNDNHRKKHG